MIRLQSGEWQNVAQYVHSICAISLDHSKDYLIESRLNAVMAEIGCSSFTQLVNRCRSDSTGGLRRRVINDITTNETLFFRDSAPFELLRHKILPELIDRRAKTGPVVPIRIWSAACSTGQEIYSIAIVLKETLGDLNRYNIRIVGTDISDDAVSRASAGVFSEIEMARGMSEAMRDRYFRRHRDGWKICDEIRSLATFRRLNLMDDFSCLGKFDIVFCRNVAIYFNEKDKASLFNGIQQRMESDGCLIIGAMESLTAVSPQFEARRHLRCVYYEVRSGAQKSIR